MQGLAGPDAEFTSLVNMDEQSEQLQQEGTNWNERSKDIVGLKREKIDNLNSLRKMTTKQKIEKELTYVTQALDLDP